MAQKELVLVTGANGHLGNNLVRLLLQKGFRVRASVRNIDNKAPFRGLDCEVVQADITNKESMIKALQGVDVFYAVGAVFKLWAKDPKAEIYDVNIAGCQIMVEAAAQAGVRRVVYVSSIAALDYSKTPINESAGYNPDRRDTYYCSKNDGEKLAFQLAQEHSVDLVAVMPSAMIGSEIVDRLSNSNTILRSILTGQLSVETRATLNWIDVKDVAEGCYLAAMKGRNGERYILANEKCMSITESLNVANRLIPELKLKQPATVPKFVLYTVAWFMKQGTRVAGKEPVLTPKDVSMFWGLVQDFDISKARKELGFNPKPCKQALEEALLYMWKNKDVLLA